jgi:hypothetical protein
VEAAAAAKIYTSSGTTLQSSSFLMEHAYTSNPRSPVPPKKKLLLSAATFKTQCTNEYTLEPSANRSPLAVSQVKN